MVTLANSARLETRADAIFLSDGGKKSAKIQREISREVARRANVARLERVPTLFRRARFFPNSRAHVVGTCQGVYNNLLPEPSLLNLPMNRTKRLRRLTEKQVYP